MFQGAYANATNRVSRWFFYVLHNAAQRICIFYIITVPAAAGTDSFPTGHLYPLYQGNITAKLRAAKDYRKKSPAGRRRGPFPRLTLRRHSDTL